MIEGSGTAAESTAAARAQDGEQTAAAWRAMPMSALRKLAKGAGVGPSELRAAKDSKRPKDVLIDLLRAAGAGGEEAVQAAAQPAEPASTDDVAAAAAAAPATAKAGAAADRAFLSEWPFDTDYGDHYETPLRAYHDVRPLLRQVARDAGVSRGKVRVSVGRGVCQLGGACVSWAGRGLSVPAVRPVLLPRRGLAPPGEPGLREAHQQEARLLRGRRGRHHSPPPRAAHQPPLLRCVQPRTLSMPPV
eukprot:COSAG01_NODE_3302_length_6295_cov_3.185765_7_plen_247_part_00